MYKLKIDSSRTFTFSYIIYNIKNNPAEVTLQNEKQSNVKLFFCSTTKRRLGYQLDNELNGEENYVSNMTFKYYFR